MLAALEGHPAQVALDDPPGLDAPAVSRYATTTPELLRWFDRYNAGKPYREQVRPFGFMLAFQARPDVEPTLIDEDETSTRRRGPSALQAPAVVAPFDKDPWVGAARAFDRVTGEPVAVSRLATYRPSLAQYHLHPETKFHGGDYLDAGPTSRRHVRPLGPINNIGKEANRWEEQFYLGANPEAQIDYSVGDTEPQAYAETVRQKAKRHGVRAISREAPTSVGTVSAFLRGPTCPGLGLLRAIDCAADRLDARATDDTASPKA